MSEWKEVISGEVLDLISGYAFKSKDFKEVPDEDDLPVIKIKNVANGDVNFEGVVYHQVSEKLEKYTLEKGDILIAMTGNHPHAMTQVVGDVSRYKLAEKALLNQRVGKLVAKDDNCLDFFYYYFKDEDNRNYLANQSSGSANQANISKGDILGIPMTIPEPDEQRAIAEVLSSLDDKMDLLHRQNQTLEQIAETLFRQWFVEEADDSWEILKLAEIVALKQGKYIKAQDISELQQEGFKYPLYGGNGVRGYLNTYKFYSPKVAITCRGNGCGLVQLLNPMSTVSNSCIVFDNDETISTWFLYYYAKELDFASVTSGSAQPQITITDIGTLELLIPDSETIERFDQQVSLYHQRILSNQKQIETLSNLRDSLLPKLISGEISIDTDE